MRECRENLCFEWWLTDLQENYTIVEHEDARNQHGCAKGQVLSYGGEKLLPRPFHVGSSTGEVYLYIVHRSG